jgi:anaerobic magnesium-protoporphyrin IX monomethyl ester cyclase
MQPDVLFGQAYFLRFDPKLWEAQQPYPPLGTLYAAAVVRARGHRVGLFDAMLAQSEAEWAAALDAQRPRVAVLFEDSFNYLSKMCLLRMREAALTMIDAARARGIPIVVAGSDASDHPDIYLDRGAELVIAGEGETTVADVVDAMTGASAAAIPAIDGICYRGIDGRIVRTRSRDIIRDLDALPPPAWDLLDVERYRAVWRARHGYFSMNIVTTRGCPYHCNWCAKPIYGQRYSARSPEGVASEVAWLKRTYAPDHLWIADDIFGLKPGWIETYADLVAAKDAVTPFKCLLRADGVSETAARTLARAGCREAWMGAESGAQDILDAMEKGTRVEQIYAATRALKDAGIKVGFFLQFGYPGETLEHIEKTLQMVRECEPDDIGVSVSYPLPGTPFYDRVRAQLGSKQNWVDSSDLAMMYRATYVPEFYRALHALVHAQFRSRRRGSLRTLAAAVYHACRIPGLRRSVRRLSRARTVSAPPPPLLLIPVLSQHAASIPSEQPH